MTDLDVAMKEIRSELGLDRNQERELYFLTRYSCCSQYFFSFIFVTAIKYLKLDRRLRL